MEISEKDLDELVMSNELSGGSFYGAVSGFSHHPYLHHYSNNHFQELLQRQWLVG